MILTSQSWPRAGGRGWQWGPSLDSPRCCCCRNTWEGRSRTPGCTAEQRHCRCGLERKRWNRMEGKRFKYQLHHPQVCRVTGLPYLSRRSRSCAARRGWGPSAREESCTECRGLTPPAAAATETTRPGDSHSAESSSGDDWEEEDEGRDRGDRRRKTKGETEEMRGGRRREGRS